MSGTPKKIVVVGAGITGLTAAFRIQAQAVERELPVHCTVLEASSRIGGKILTEAADGFVIEAGPDSFLAQKPWAVDLCRKLGLADRLIGTNPEQPDIFVLTGGRLTKLPLGWRLLVPTRIGPFLRSPLFSWPGKLRLALEPFIPSRSHGEDESVAEFVRRRLGREAVEKLAEPLLAGIYAGDPERMSLAATFPQFAEMEAKYGSLLRGMRATAGSSRRRAIPSSRRRAIPTADGDKAVFMTLRGGLRELVESLSARLGKCEVVTRTPVRAVTVQARGYRVEPKEGPPIECDAVILTTPAYIAADALAGLDGAVAEQMRQIRYTGTATVTFAFRRSQVRHPLNGFGFVVTAGEQLPILACTWTSTKFPQRAPADHVLIRSFVGGSRQEALVGMDEQALSLLVRNTLKPLLGLEGPPVLARVYRWERANPQYEIGHLARLSAIESGLARFPGLYLAGAAYRGVGIPDCIHQGGGAADRVLQHLFG